MFFLSLSSTLSLLFFIVFDNDNDRFCAFLCAEMFSSPRPYSRSSRWNENITTKRCWPSRTLTINIPLLFLVCFFETYHFYFPFDPISLPSAFYVNHLLFHSNDRLISDRFFIRTNIMDKFGIPIIIFTVFWGLVGIVLPFLLPKGPNRRWFHLSSCSTLSVLSFRLIQTMLMLTSACCWLL